MERQRWGGDLPDVIHGCWQLSTGHGDPWSDAEVAAALDGAAEGPGPCALDMADIYTGVESRVGNWLARRPPESPPVRIHTKFVPDLAALGRVDRRWVQASVDRSLARLRVERLDLVQFHWWDFAVPGWIEAAAHLAELVREGKVGAMGVTNFDTERLDELLRAGVPVVSNQVQLSVVDRRPLGTMADLCRARGVALLCYGTLAGGLLTAGWTGRERPAPGNRSVAKYLQVVDEIGGWGAFQSVHGALVRIAASTGLTLEEVVMSYARFQPAVASIIVGLTRTRRPRPRLVRLEEAEKDALERELPPTLAGDVYQAERDSEGPHARLMRVDLGGTPS